ncbi:hypothetical protein MIMGU_mgv1a021834mg [Erythranthe guttata]|uniref:Uncharacterized protein n=1 Tax=Erythranthe guttata TaxID=4155 RepID=A0A022QYS2_ERYGU|nr:hypothetical protein MIMGU_mgv1a021834mg [Erythranthe guttata]
MACCLLHNFIRQEMGGYQLESDDDLDDGEGEQGMESESEDSEDESDEEHINVIEPSNEWTTFRNNLAVNIKWKYIEDAKLVQVLLDMVNLGLYKAENGFKPGYLNYVEEKMQASLPNSGLKAKPHIESRIKTLKKDLHIVSHPGFMSLEALNYFSSL